ncbi:MAG TPA: peptidylprolyl isomerase [Actinomycetes bacterium]|nr:peptidylprolyl isomerase [Actinomycetes bacterium]
MAVVLLVAGCGKSSSPEPSGVPRGQAAVVGGVSISVDQLNAVAKADQAVASQQGTPAPTGAALNRQALGELVQSQIILQGAKQEGITVSDAEVEAQLNDLRAQVTEQNTNFDEALRQRGLTLDLLREQLRPQLAAQKVTAKLVPAKVSDAELAKRRAEFPQVHVRHVLVQDKATADTVRAKLAAGGSWNDLAKQYSKDTGSKDNGGDLGFTSRGQTVPEFEKAVFALAKQGSCKGRTSGACTSPVSQPVKSQFGYHLIQVIGLRLPPIDDQLRDQVEPGLQQRRQNALQQWFKDHATKAQVRIDPAYGKWNPADATVVDPSAPQTSAPSSGGAPSSTP